MRGAVPGDTDTMTALRSLYGVRGDFYQWDCYECRRALDIVLQSSSVTDPDFMVVMMNPGGSKPTAGQPTHGYLKAGPDKTQDQIMALMRHAGFEYARILNLSDIREANSQLFRNELRKLGSNQGHSIFDTSRAVEFQRLFVTGVPVLTAWGVHSDLKGLAKLAVNAIGAADVRALKKCGSTWANYHPLPFTQSDRVKWLNGAKALF
jgi:hypothetical protein